MECLLENRETEERKSIAEKMTLFPIESWRLEILLWVVVLVIPLGIGGGSSPFIWFSHGIVLFYPGASWIPILSLFQGVTSFSPILFFFLVSGSLVITSAILTSVYLRTGGGASYNYTISLVASVLTIGIGILLSLPILWNLLFLQGFVITPISPILQVLIADACLNKPHLLIGAKIKGRRGLIPRSESVSLETDALIQVTRGGEFIGNRFRFKVKVLNTTPLVITDVTITLVAYPRDSLRLDGEASRCIAKLDPEGFRTPTFDLLPTQDCVKGDLVASVTYIDSRGQAHSVMSKPFIIRAVCDLLSPEAITPEDYMLKLATLGHGEMATKVDDWTPEEMHEKTLQILDMSNFFEVDSEIHHHEEYFESINKGWAKGIYTGKNLGVEIVISGKAGKKGATCKVRMAGEDEAMIMPAIDEISNKLGAWLCPKCHGRLPLDAVDDLKAGKSICCPFCGVTMDR